MWFLIVCFILFTVHLFFIYIDKTPYFAVDDGLGNVSYTIATEGRFAFPASPTVNTGKQWGHRMEGLLTYGPWYFYIGALVTWLFGYSVAALRFVHLLVLLLLIFMSYKWFKGPLGKTVAGVFAVLLLHCFNTVHWPMIRPDTAVSLFAVLFVIFSGWAIRDKRSIIWMPAGFFASCAAFTHLIAWSVIPACAVVFVIGQYINWKEMGRGSTWWKQFVYDLIMVIFGGLLGAFVYYETLGFRIRDHLNIVMNYSSFVDKKGTGPQFFKTMTKHFQSAFSALGYNLFLQWVFLLITVSGPFLLVFSIQKKWIKIRETMAYCAPPILIFCSYILSLGTYKNYHAGYSILLQVSAFWSIAAVLLFFGKITQRRSPLIASLSSVILVIIVSIWILQDNNRAVASAVHRSQSAQKNVSIQRYHEAATELLPIRAKVWGTVLYGMETPGRIQLVQFSEGYRLTSRVKRDQRAKLAPDYLIMGYVENRDSTLSVLRGGMTVLRLVRASFPDLRYKLISIVAGAPYGVTRVYQRYDPNDMSEQLLPALSVYDQDRKQWARITGDQIDVTPEATNPARFQVGWTSDVPWAKADRTLRVQLQEGWYLIRVTLKPGADKVRKGMMIAVTNRLNTTQTIPETGPDFDTTPYLPGEQSVCLVHRHEGEDAYISQFDKDPDAGIEQIEVFPIQFLTDFAYDTNQQQLSLPPLRNWHVCQGGKAEIGEDGTLLVTGDTTRFGYQLWSPPIQVKDHSKAILKLPFTRIHGAVGVGILSRGGFKWILPAVGVKGRYVFDTGENREITIAIANYRTGKLSERPSEFTVQSGYLQIRDVNGKWYSDILIDANNRNR